MSAPPRILIIAGSDSSGGAGIQADIKTVTMLGGYALTAVTAVTAQNTLGVQAVHTVPAEMVGKQIDSCFDDIDADTVKIGMLGSAEIAHVVADRLEPASWPIVFDPVMVATSGAELADEATIAAFRRLMSLATVITPNLPELEKLSGMPCKDEEAIIAAAASLAERSRCAVLAKGGHKEGDKVLDILVEDDGRVTRFADRRIETPHTHGTGCTLASALATELGRGAALPAAVTAARKFVRSALQHAPGFGKGAGPLGHQAVR